MELQHAIGLIQNKYIIKEGASVWTDLGCGSGLFTHALGGLLNTGSRIFAVDSSRAALSKIDRMHEGIRLEKIQADFVRDELPFCELDGILMANALHFVKDKVSFIKRAAAWLKHDGYFLMVEYDTDHANQWVPYPLSFITLKNLFMNLGYNSVVRLQERPSVYNRANIYSCIVGNGKGR